MATSTLALTISDSGVSIPTLQEIFTALKEMHQGVFSTTTDGVSYTLDLDATSPDGMAVALQARQIRRLFEMAQTLAQLVNVNTATGTWLDRLAALKGLTRNDGETDDELRERILSSSTSGLATYDNMLSYLKDKLGNSVQLIMNDTDETDEGDDSDTNIDSRWSTYYPRDYLPPHSFAVFAPCNYMNTGDVTYDEAAQAIWDCKPAGIEPHYHTYYETNHSFGYSSAAGTATDAAGNSHSVGFFFLYDIPVTLTVTITSYNTTTWAELSSLKEVVLESVTETAASLLKSDSSTLSGYACLAGVYSLGIYAASVEASVGQYTTMATVDDSETVTAFTGCRLYLYKVSFSDD